MVSKTDWMDYARFFNIILTVILIIKKVTQNWK